MRRPQRADDWDDWWPDQINMMGSVHDLSASEASERSSAVLWLPDPEQRHGWREFYVSPEKPQAKPKGKMGFR